MLARSSYGLGLAMLLASCRGAAGPDSSPTPRLETAAGYAVVVPDNGSNRVKVIAPASARLLYELDLAESAGEVCAGSGGCMIFSADHALLEGHDHLDVAYGLPTGALQDAFQGYIDRVLMSSPPALRWRLHALDFSGLPGGAAEYCPADPNESCRPVSDATPTEADLCYVGDAHDFEVILDDPVSQTVELVVADTDNYRLLKVRLQYADGNTCGRVESILDNRRNAAWAPLSQPNNLVRQQVEGRELYLVTLRSTTLTNNWLDGMGQIQLWELEPDGSWRRHWTFPEPAGDGSSRVLHYPHGGELVAAGHPEGDIFLFADSASLSDEPAQSVYDSPGGSVGVLLLRDLLEQPDYLYDAYVSSPGQQWSFPRAATRVGDGTVLVTDSGCISPVACPFSPRLVWMPDLIAQNSSRMGYWTPDHAELELVDQAGEMTGALECGLVGPYASQLVPQDGWGEELEALMAEGGRACPTSMGRVRLELTVPE